MKRKYFFLIATLLICGVMNAQENHYVFNYHYFAHKITIVAQININGVEQTSSDYEIGAFDGTAVTGSARIGEYGSNHYHRAYFAVFYNTGYDATFKLYNHATGEELTNCTITNHLGEPLTFVWEDENGYGTNKKPVIFNFVTTPAPTFTKEITGYGTGTGRYYLIATPIDDMNPEDVDGMIADNADDYDLYWFDQTEELEWRNYKQGSFDLVSGMGYLYASKDDVALSFSGTPIDGPTYEVSLVKDDEAELAGWNLIGNPFAEHTAYINRNFYVMNPAGTEIVAATEPGIAPMEGVFVVATEDGEPLTFSTAAPSKRNQQIVVNVTRERGVAIDRAIIRFGENSALPKFMLNEANTKVFIPQEGKDYAVVNADDMGEIPVSFKAAENGTYSISINVKDVRMSYLHLIDNLTNVDINLLETPSYNFEAKTTDYANRFKLVFSLCGNTDGENESFAFISNGNLVVLNDGEATFQIIDMTGRIVNSQNINGTVEINLNQAEGMYVMRLVNGNDKKVQKIVVR